ncbi:MAG: glycine oxidase ThiO [Ktedonobacteraceae bacterium]
MKHSADVLIVGGGIIGCSIAYFLRKRGIEVIVLEKGHIGAQASSAAAGLLAPIRPLSQRDPFKALQLAGLTRFSSLVPELEAVSGINVGYEQTGTLRLLPGEKVVPVYTWAEAWRRSGYHIEVLTPAETYKREPLLSPELHGAVSIADEAQVVPVQLVQAYAQAALNLGAMLYAHTEVVTLQRSETGNRITGVRTDQGDLLTCNQLIIAAGAWSAKVGTWLGLTFPVRPVRGELIALQQPSSPLHHIIFDEGIFDEDIYIAPKPNGTIVVGATKADLGFDTSVSAGGALHLLNVATPLMPALAHCSIERMWAGLRPKTLDSRPLLGPLPSWENVSIASGHGGFGILLSAITGETIAELITTGQAPEIIRPFTPKENTPNG